MSTDLYKNSRELFNWAQEAALAPQGGLNTALKKKWQVLSATQLGSCDSPATDISMGSHSHNSYHLLMPVVCRRLCSGFHIFSP